MVLTLTFSRCAVSALVLPCAARLKHWISRGERPQQAACPGATWQARTGRRHSVGAGPFVLMTSYSSLKKRCQSAGASPPLFKGFLAALRFLLCLASRWTVRSEEHTSELQSRENLVCRL